MKVSKIPGLGRFGNFIDDLDFNTITDEEWMEIGQLHLQGLVTIIRNANLNVQNYESWMNKWGTYIFLTDINLQKKYGVQRITKLIGKTEWRGHPIDHEDQRWLQAMGKIRALEISPITVVSRVTGKKDEDGNPLGMFNDGELLWHSNESSQINFTPGVSLFGHEGMIGSATGFMTTPDWYEAQTESFRSELDEMIVEHRYTPGRITPGLSKEQDVILHRNMCPEDSLIPLVIKSPVGIKGLHFPINTVNKIKGMSEEDSIKLFDKIKKELFVEKYTYDHWYQNENDLCIFDNSITLHRRLGGITNRLAYRIQFDYNKIAPTQWNPYSQQEYADLYNKEKHEVDIITRRGR
jgi:alpha-ketoglutarate-dependent taurine dioxygenase